MKAIQIARNGSPDTLTLQNLLKPELQHDEVLIRVEYAGINMVDTYYRNGLYKTDLPFTPGMETAGIIEAVAEDVKDFAVGERVVSVMHQGGYAEYHAVPTKTLVKIPEGLDTRLAAAASLQGFTAYFLSHLTYQIKSGDVVLIHAAAGGVGGLLSQLANLRGAEVIGTVSSNAKAERALACGCSHIIRYDQLDFEKEVKRLTSGKGAHVVYDSVGNDTFLSSLRCLKPRGTLVTFGQSSGEISAFDLQLLRKHGSLYVTRPSLNHYMQPKEEFRKWASNFLSLVKDGKIKVEIAKELALEDAATAHELIESRTIAGKILLKV